VGQAILVCCPIFLLLSWVRTLKWIGWLSNIANLALVLAIVVIAYYGISHYDTWDINLLSSVISWDTYPLSFGLFVFAFEGINLVGLLFPPQTTSTPILSSSINLTNLKLGLAY